MTRSQVSSSSPKANKLNHGLNYILPLNYKLTLVTHNINNAGHAELTRHTKGEKASGLPSAAAVKNEWSSTSALPICLHGLDRGNFTFTFYFVWWFVSSFVTRQTRHATIRSSPNTMQPRDVTTAIFEDMKQSQAQFVHRSQFVYRWSWPVYHKVRRNLHKRLKSSGMLRRVDW